MQLQQPFNAQAVDPTQGAGFKPLMLGKYPCVITASEIKANRDANTGGQCIFEVQAIAGPDQGKTGQWILNLYHTDDVTRGIAERTLSAICHATGQFLLQDTAQLHNLPFALDVSEQALSAKQQADKEAGKNVTPFRQVRVLNADGTDIQANGGNQQQTPAAAAPAPQQQWSAPAAQAPAAAPAPAAGGWGGAPSQAPAQAPAAAPAAAGWQQQAPAATGGQPAWGKR